MNALEEAWGIIANASDWDAPDSEHKAMWLGAAKRFRDETYGPALRRYCNRQIGWHLARFRLRHQ